MDKNNGAIRSKSADRALDEARKKIDNTFDISSQDVYKCASMPISDMWEDIPASSITEAAYIYAVGRAPKPRQVYILFQDETPGIDLPLCIKIYPAKKKYRFTTKPKKQYY